MIVLDILKSIKQSYGKKKYDWKKLEENKIPLTEEEKEKVMSAGAVWNHGPNGEESPAVWKTTDPKTKDILYICNTHRACAIKPTLAKAIASYKFIKTTS